MTINTKEKQEKIRFKPKDHKCDVLILQIFPTLFNDLSDSRGGLGWPGGGLAVAWRWPGSILLPGIYPGFTWDLAGALAGLAGWLGWLAGLAGWAAWVGCQAMVICLALATELVCLHIKPTLFCILMFGRIISN